MHTNNTEPYRSTPTPEQQLRHDRNEACRLFLRADLHSAITLLISCQHQEIALLTAQVSILEKSARMLANSDLRAAV